jgi:hypothetical protein|tara:strand:- start:384 stop:581 length:198 start_codon:yes stop_codon:yes gene_type:complete
VIISTVRRSISSALDVAGDISGYPVTHAVVVHISVFSHQELIGVEIICEAVRIYLQKTHCATLDE